MARQEAPAIIAACTQASAVAIAARTVRRVCCQGGDSSDLTGQVKMMVGSTVEAI